MSEKLVSIWFAEFEQQYATNSVNTNIGWLPWITNIMNYFGDIMVAGFP